MASKTFQVPGLVSEQDFSILENALRQAAGVSRVDVERPTKEFTVEWSDPADWDELERIMTDLGYVPEM
jgi:hypothetical protein